MPRKYNNKKVMALRNRRRAKGANAGLDGIVTSKAADNKYRRFLTTSSKNRKAGFDSNGNPVPKGLKGKEKVKWAQEFERTARINRVKANAKKGIKANTKKEPKKIPNTAPKVGVNDKKLQKEVFGRELTREEMKEHVLQLPLKPIVQGTQGAKRVPFGISSRKATSDIWVNNGGKPKFIGKLTRNLRTGDITFKRQTSLQEKYYKEGISPARHGGVRMWYKGSDKAKTWSEFKAKTKVAFKTSHTSGTSGAPLVKAYGGTKKLDEIQTASRMKNYRKTTGAMTRDKLADDGYGSDDLIDQGLGTSETNLISRGSVFHAGRATGQSAFKKADYKSSTVSVQHALSNYKGSDFRIHKGKVYIKKGASKLKVPKKIRNAGRLFP